MVGEVTGAELNGPVAGSVNGVGGGVGW